MTQQFGYQLMGTFVLQWVEQMEETLIFTAAVLPGQVGLTFSRDQIH